MKKTIKSILLTGITLTFVLASTVSPIQAKSKGKKTKSTKTKKATPAKAEPKEATEVQDSWQTFSSKEGRFSVLLPSQPQVLQQEHPTLMQGTLIQTMYLASTNNGAIAYGASYEPQKVMAPEKNQYAILTTMPENGGGQVVRLDNISVKGTPGITYIKEMPNGSIQMIKAFVVMSKGCLYQLTFLAPNKQTAEAEMKNLQKFFNSFKLL